MGVTFCTLSRCGVYRLGDATLGVLWFFWRPRRLRGLRFNHWGGLGGFRPREHGLAVLSGFARPAVPHQQLPFPFKAALQSFLVIRQPAAW